VNQFRAQYQAPNEPVVGTVDYPQPVRRLDSLRPRCSAVLSPRSTKKSWSSRRLQLAPGLMPPTSWSLSPCCGPKFHLRAEGRDASRGPSFPVHSRGPPSDQNRNHVPMRHAGSRPESARRSGSPRGEPADRGRVSNMVSRRHARLVGQRTSGMVGTSAGVQMAMKWVKADDLRPAREP
jgi:hypothetical protein